MLWTRRLIVASVGLHALAPAVGLAAELVMFEQRACPWCAEWDRVIGPIYAKSDVARRAPLRRVQKEGPQASEYTLLRPIRFTPTFVLIDDGKEIGRIEGYPGEDFFWARAERLIERLPASPQSPR